MNKIILKNQLVNDPIFARANPIHQEIALGEQHQFLNDETIQFVMSSAASISDFSVSGQGARRRLFTKKNEKTGAMFDPNASTASSTTSSATTPVHHNPYFSAFQATTSNIFHKFFI